MNTQKQGETIFRPDRYKIIYNKESDNFSLLFGEFDGSDKKVNIHSNIEITSNDFKYFFNSIISTILDYNSLNNSNFLDGCIEVASQIDKGDD